MIRISIVASVIALITAGCVSPGPQPGAAANAGVAKRITRDGTQLVLPDGTRVTPDATGGFSLPNGDRVTRDPSGALILPTGAHCAPSAGGYVCP